MDNNNKKKLAGLGLIAVTAAVATQVITHNINNNENTVIPDSFTLMVYMNGSDLESRYSLATDDINEMLSELPEYDGFNTVLMTGGTKKWQSQNLPSDKIIYSHISNDGFEKKEELPNVSIGDSDTLSDFLEYGISNYPAERYGLIFWNHGGGSVIGFGNDELYTDTSLNLTEIKTGLTEGLGDVKLSFIGFDACLMSSIEIASVCSPYAEYMIASEELEPGGGWSYDKLFKAVNSKTDTFNLCRGIVDSFIESDDICSADQLTLSVIDLNKIDTAVTAMGELALAVEENIDLNFSDISKIRNNVKTFGRPSLNNFGTDMIDIIDLAENLSELYPSESNNVINTVTDAVVYSRFSDNVTNVGGLSVYFPYSNKKTAKSLDNYLTSPFNSDYLNMTRTLASKITETSYNIPEIPVDEDELSLSSDILASTVDIYAVLMQKNNEKLIMMGYDSDIDIDQNTGKISTNFSGEWVSINDIIVSIHSIKHTEDIILYSSPVLLCGESAELIISYDDENPSGAVIGAKRISDIPDKGYISILPGDEIIFLYEDFNTGDLLQGEKITAGDELIVDVINVPDGEYLYGFCLVDIYQNKHFTDLKDLTF